MNKDTMMYNLHWANNKDIKEELVDFDINNKRRLIYLSTSDHKIVTLDIETGEPKGEITRAH